MVSELKEDLQNLLRDLVDVRLVIYLFVYVFINRYNIVFVFVAFMFNIVFVAPKLENPFPYWPWP